MTSLERVLNSDSGQSRVTVSWTVFVCPSGTSEEVTCSCTGKADILGYLLATRPFGQCILIGTLLEAIYNASGATRWLDLISGSGCESLGRMWVATIRAPVFGHLRYPVSGYEILGEYDRVREFTGMPGPSYMYEKEAVSCDPDSPHVQSFFRDWGQRKEIEPETHFFIVFEDPRLSSPLSTQSSLCCRTRSRTRSRTPSCNPSRTSRTPSRAPSRTPSRTPSSRTLSPLVTKSTSSRALAERSQALTSAIGHLPSSRGISLDLDSNEQGLTNVETDCLPHEDELTAGLDVEAVCRIMGISTAFYEAAFYHPATSNTPLYTVLTNFKPLLSILEVLKLEEPKTRRSYMGGLVLSTVEVLEFFHWNEFSYNKKYVAYLWAQKMARATWKGAIPSKGRALYPLYRRWRGIVWFFQPGGGLDQGTPPDKLRQSADPDEAAAAELKQTMLLDRRRELEDVLTLC